MISPDYLFVQIGIEINHVFGGVHLLHDHAFAKHAPQIPEIKLLVRSMQRLLQHFSFSANKTGVKAIRSARAEEDAA